MNRIKTFKKIFIVWLLTVLVGTFIFSIASNIPVLIEKKYNQKVNSNKGSN